MIAGDLGVLEAAADQLESTGTRLDAAGDVIARQARVLASQWTGNASDAANARLTTLSSRAGVGSDATSAAGPVLRIFADELRAAQAAYAEAQAEAQAAGAAFTAATQAGQTATAAGLDATTHVAASEQASADQRGAHHEMTAAVARAERANATAARQINALTAQLDGMRIDGSSVPRVTARNRDSDLLVGRHPVELRR